MQTLDLRNERLKVVAEAVVALTDQRNLLPPLVALGLYYARPKVVSAADTVHEVSKRILIENGATKIGENYSLLPSAPGHPAAVAAMAELMAGSTPIELQPVLLSVISGPGITISADHIGALVDAGIVADDVTSRPASA